MTRSRQNLTRAMNLPGDHHGTSLPCMIWLHHSSGFRLRPRDVHLGSALLAIQTVLLDLNGREIHIEADSQEAVMPRNDPNPRHPDRHTIDQRQQQIDPAGKNRDDENRRPDTNTKQPGNLPERGKPRPSD